MNKLDVEKFRPLFLFKSTFFLYISSVEGRVL